MDYKVEYTLFIFVIFICMKSGNLRAFTFVELIITLSILALLSVI
ncbi:MAG: pilus assembly FimT family protein [Patescibacteria group bacterium]